MSFIDDFVSWIQGEVDHARAFLRVPGIAVALSHKGERYFFTAGHAVLDDQTPYTMDTKFRIGSVTKVLTATALLILHEQGKLGLYDPVQYHLPFVKLRYHRKLREPVRLNHLFTHSSGLGEVRNGFDYWSSDFHYTVKTPDEIDHERLYQAPLSLGFHPGNNWYYSNHGFGLLGAVIEKVTGKMYAQAMQDLVFTPLALKSITVHTQDVTPPYAKSYQLKKKRLREVKSTEISLPSAGNIWSNFHDMLTYGEAINDSYEHYSTQNASQFICNAQTLLKPWFSLHPSLTKHGMSFFLNPTKPLIALHGGTIDGFNTYFAIVPEQELVLIISINRLNREHFFAWSSSFLTSLLKRLNVNVQFTIPPLTQNNNTIASSRQSTPKLLPSKPLPSSIPSNLRFSHGTFTLLFPRVITSFGVTLELLRKKNRLFLYSKFKPFRGSVPLAYTHEDEHSYYFQFLYHSTPVNLILSKDFQSIYMENVLLFKYNRSPPHPRSRIIEPLVYNVLNPILSS